MYVCSKLSFVLVLFVFFCINICAQSDTIAYRKKIFIGLGAGYCFINPEEVNEAILEKIDEDDVISGTPKINAGFLLFANLAVYTTKNIEILGEFEFDLGMKEMESWFGPSIYNTLLRLGYGGYGNYHFNFSPKHAIYIGSGVNYNKLYLNAFDGKIKGKASPIGVSFQLGYSISRTEKRKGRFELQYNLIKGDNKEKGGVQVKTIDFSGFSVKFAYML